MARLSPRDARAWHALGGRVATALEPRLGPEVVANRVLVSRGGWRLESLEAALRRLEARLEARLEDFRASPEDGTGYLATDVAEFFPSVSPDAAARALLAASASPEDATRVAVMLEGWAELGYRGLPIGPAASAVIANAVLLAVDGVIGAPFVRWVDDYLVAVGSDRGATEVLERMDEAMERSGLRRSLPKTRLSRGPGWLGSALGSSLRSSG
jgi:hypothetical protein